MKLCKGHREKVPWCMCNVKKNCKQKSPSGLKCCREKGHKGGHVACNCTSQDVMEKWS